MRRVTLALVVFSILLTAGTAAAQGEGFEGGWLAVNGPFTVRAGQPYTFHLAQAGFPLCLPGGCFGQTPTANWGDEQQTDLTYQDCTGEGGLFPLNGCQLLGTHTYATPGIYVVSVTYYRTCCLYYRAVTAVIVEPNVGTFVHTPLPLESFRIVSVGDSVASGEGNPEVPWLETFASLPYALWQDGHGPNLTVGNTSPCHRSSKAGPALAAAMIGDQNPGTSLVFAHLACTGANTTGVIEQLKKIENKIGRQPIDALLMSVGANDSRDTGEASWSDGSFGSVVNTCAYTPNCQANTDVYYGLQRKFSDLPNHYANLAAEMDALFTPREGAFFIPVENVYITEYFDPTRDIAGRFGYPLTLNCTLDVIAPLEWEFLYNQEVVPLNAAVRAAAALHNWHVVDGIALGFLNHGYCNGSNSERWVVTLEESLASQRDIYGISHPNLDGHTYYAERILRTIVQQTAPRTVFQLRPPPGPVTFRSLRFEARNLAGAGAVRMEWTVYRGSAHTLNIGGSGVEVYASGVANETVKDDGVCDRPDAPTPVACHSELRQGVLLPEGWNYHVTVRSYNAWGRWSDSTFDVDLVADMAPPSVTAPPDLTVVTSEAGGVRGAAVPQLAAYLAGGSATDDTDPHPTRLPTREVILDIGGSVVNNTSLFRVGRTTLEFRFQDAAGNIGSATSTLTVLPSPDVNHDGIVNQSDVAIVKASLLKGTFSGFNPAADLNNDRIVDVRDVAILLQNLNRVYPK